MGRNRVQALEHHLHVSGDQIVDGHRAALVRHVDDVGAGHVLEQLAAHVSRRAVARGRVHELSRILLRKLHQLAYRGGRQRGRHREQQVPAGHERDRLQVPLDVVGKLRNHVARNRERPYRSHSYRVSIRRRLRYKVYSDRQRSTGAVLDDDRLPERGRHLGGENARDGVGGASRRLRNDQSNRTLGIPLRGRGNGERRQPRAEQQALHVSRRGCCCRARPCPSAASGYRATAPVLRGSRRPSLCRASR